MLPKLRGDYLRRCFEERLERATPRTSRPAYPAYVRPRLERLAVSAMAVAAVTGAVFALKEIAPVLSLGALYLFAVLPVAVFYGLPCALAVSIASMLAFNYFFLPPLHTLALTDSGNWVALAVYIVTAVVVSELAARARRRGLRRPRPTLCGAATREDRGAALGQPRPALAADRD